jgi:hypothetical protein
MIILIKQIQNLAESLAGYVSFGGVGLPMLSILMTI